MRSTFLSLVFSIVLLSGVLILSSSFERGDKYNADSKTKISSVATAEVPSNNANNNPNESTALLKSPKSLTKNTPYRGKSSSTSIVEKLWNEALSDNPNLKSLQVRIGATNLNSGKQLDEYREYTSKTNGYLNSVNNVYLDQISNTSLRESTAVLLEQLEANWKASTKVQDAKWEELSTKQVSLQDQEVVLKLAVTAAMLQRYNQNELPSIDQLDALLKDYTGLIEQAKQEVSNNKQPPS